MTCYSMPTPRAALGVAAAAMTVLTFAVLVVMPSQMEPGSQAYAQLANPRLMPATDCARQPGSGAGPAYHGRFAV
jgi:hypothetical protein